jgi:hypothetical protein
MINSCNQCNLFTLTLQRKSSSKFLDIKLLRVISRCMPIPDYRNGKVMKTIWEIIRLKIACNTFTPIST